MNRQGVRVIVVGRTPLEQGLRRDASVELIRARTSMDAIGELADPIDAASPRDVVVVVGEHAGLGADESSGFVRALREVDPGVRVLSVGNVGYEGFDGHVGPDATGPDLRAAARLNGVPHTGEQTTGTETDTETETETDTTPDPGAEPGAPSAEASVRSVAPSRPVEVAIPDDRPARSDADPIEHELDALRAVLGDADVSAALLESIRRRLGVRDVRFIPVDTGRPEPGVASAEVRAPLELGVGIGSRRFGWLVSPSAEARALAGEASRLGHWLTLQEEHHLLRTQALVDDLTGALNRRGFFQHLRATLTEAAERRLPVTVMVFDVDDFKTYNDRFGHAAGDDILRESVRLMKSAIRPTDRVCRVGGDEFAVVFFEPDGPRDPASKPATVVTIAERFQRQIAAHRFPKLGAEARGELTISAGLATYPWDGRTPEELLQQADVLAIESKRRGKNAITMGPDIDRRDR